MENDSINHFLPLFDRLLHRTVALVPEVPELVVRDHDAVVGRGFLDDVAVVLKEKLYQFFILNSHPEDKGTTSGFNK